MLPTEKILQSSSCSTRLKLELTSTEMCMIIPNYMIYLIGLTSRFMSAESVTKSTSNRKQARVELVVRHSTARHRTGRRVPAFPSLGRNATGSAPSRTTGAAPPSAATGTTSTPTRPSTSAASTSARSPGATTQYGCSLHFQSVVQKRSRYSST